MDELSIKLARTAVYDHFEEAYGSDVTKISAWQQLCQDVGAEVGPSITQCKKNLKGIYVNIIDFVHAINDDEEVRTFNSAKALSKYIRERGRAKIFPLHMAKQNYVLRWMLIHVR